MASEFRQAESRLWGVKKASAGLAGAEIGMGSDMELAQPRAQGVVHQACGAEGIVQKQGGWVDLRHRHEFLEHHWQGIQSVLELAGPSQQQLAVLTGLAEHGPQGWVKIDEAKRWCKRDSVSITQ